MNRTPPDIDALDRLHRAGWSIGDVAFDDGAAGLAWLVWLVWGSNGENLIRACLGLRWRMAGQEERLHPKGATAIATQTTTSQSSEATKKL
jgi:hypothetical protein